MSSHSVAVELLRALADWGIRALALGTGVTTFLAVVRLQSSRARLAVWSVVLVAVTFMPAIATISPAIQVSVPTMSREELPGAPAENARPIQATRAGAG